MHQPDFERAKQYALERLERDLSPALTYHCLAHTRDDVVPAVERLAALEGVTGEPLLLLRTAALFHDIGFTEQHADHETIGVGIAREVLPCFGYSPTHIEAIGGMVLATKLPQAPRTLSEEILADADLDVLGRDDFWSRSRDLQAELAAFGTPMTDEQWLSGQLKFMQAHRYFTVAARTLRDTMKQKNIEALLSLHADLVMTDRAKD